MNNMEVITIKKRIAQLKKERDDLFSIIDEVPFKDQFYLLEGIKDLTKTIEIHKKSLRGLLNEND